MSVASTSGGRCVRRLPVLFLLGLIVALGCADTADDQREAVQSEAPEDPQAVFWQSLEALCGQSFEGRLVESEPPDSSFDGKSFVMHVRSCEAGEIRIPFFVGDDRSRTWVITKTKSGLRLKHDHRHEDGTEDEITQYGGDTKQQGSATTQEFHADALTAELVPAASTNIWTIQVEPSLLFSYALRREDSDRRFRVLFDLRQPVQTPPPPWGE